MTITLVPEMSPASVPEWFYPPEGREWTVDDLDNLPPEAPRHVEIIDGALIVMAPFRHFHTEAIHALFHGLKGQAPDSFKVASDWAMALPNGDGPVPDVLVVDRQAYHGRNQTRVEAKDVILAVEVVSPDSRKRDLVRKPQLYAEAGIRHYWIVDDSDPTTTIQTYRLGPDGTYKLTGEHQDQLIGNEPFPIDLDLSAKALDL